MTLDLRYFDEIKQQWVATLANGEDLEQLAIRVTQNSNNLTQLAEQTNQHLAQGAIIDTEMGVRLRALEFERERFNKQSLLQGRTTITNKSHNGYFKTAEAFVIVSLSGLSQVNTNYDVHVSLVSGDSGLVGDLIVYDKTLNGFKIKMTGSAPNASIIWTLVNKGVA